MPSKILENYTAYLNAVDNKSKGTIKEYGYDISIWANYMKDNYFEINEATLKDISIAHVYEYMNHLVTKLKNGVSTRRKKLACLRSFLGYAYSLGLIDKELLAKFDEMKKPKLDERIPRHFDLEQCGKLLKGIGKRDYIRNLTIIEMFLTTGMRLSELIGLNLEDISGDCIIVKGKGAKERNIYLNSKMLTQLKAYIDTRPECDCNALFLSERRQRISKRTVQLLIEHAIRKAGLNKENRRGILVHTLRHSYATINYQAGNLDLLELQETLGHSKLDTTKIYTKVNSESLKKKAENSPINDLL